MEGHWPQNISLSNFTFTGVEMTLRALNTGWMAKCTQLRWVTKLWNFETILNYINNENLVSGVEEEPTFLYPGEKTLQDLSGLYKIFEEIAKEMWFVFFITQCNITWLLQFNTTLLLGEDMVVRTFHFPYLYLPSPALFHPAPVTHILISCTILRHFLCF